MIRKIICVVALGALAVRACGAVDLPCYPEFADRFSEYEVVTPLMAKKAVVAGNYADEVVCEPLILKDAAGVRYGYMIATFKIACADTARKWNRIIKKINAGVNIPAAQLAVELEALYGPHSPPPSSYNVVPPYTFEPPITSGGTGSLPAMIGYVATYRTVKAFYKGDDIYFSRLIARGPVMVQIFEFVNDRGDKAALEYDEYGNVNLADLEEAAEIHREYWRPYYEALKTRREKAREIRKKWFQRINRVPDDVAAQDLPRGIERRPTN